MKKLLLCLIIIILITGCHKKENELEINGIIETSQNNVSSIHYPVTHITELDNQIKDYISTIQTSFKKYENTYFLKPAELNIDYEYWNIGTRYHNVILTVFMNSSLLAHPINEVKTFVYDSEKKKFLTLTDIANINLSTLKTNLINDYKDCILINELEQTLSKDNLENIKFTFTQNEITFYFNPYEISAGFCNIIKYRYPYPDFRIQIKEEKTVESIQEYPKIKKNLSLSKPTIALTFDDGPSKYTREIVSLLKEYDASATFFILGNKVKNYKETLEFLLQNGNELGNHSYNHKQLTKLSSDDLHKQIDMTNQIVKETLNYDLKYIRPTYGAISNKLKKDLNMEVILWNVDTKDWQLRNSKKIAKKTLNDIKDGKIILMHDIYKTTLDALKIILPELKKQGYQIVTVSELKEIQALKNGK